GHRYGDNARIDLHIKWNTGETTWEKLSMFRYDDPLAVAEYAMRKKLGTMRGFKWCKQFLEERKMIVKYAIKDFTATIRKSKRVLRELRDSGKRIQYGVEVPKNAKHALEMDKLNHNNLWKIAIKKEISEMEEHKVFDIFEECQPPPRGYKQIPLMMIFAIKADGTRKARLVAGGHVTGPPESDVYASVVKSENVRLIFLLAELHHLELMMGDVSTAYLNAKTFEKVYSIAGPEFGKYESHVVVLRRALYGLKTSGYEWHAHFSNTLRLIGFHPTKGDPNLWIMPVEDWYEFICTHIDDFVIASRSPKKILDMLLKVYKIKNIGEPSYLLGADIIKREKFWTIGSKTYIKEVIVKVEGLFGALPRPRVPMTKGDHPEEDKSEILSATDIGLYQMLMGMGQWIVSLGRLDIVFAISSLSRFLACPREGHMDRILKVFGYLKKFPNREICCNPAVQDYSQYKETDCDWLQEYPDAVEEIPVDKPEPRGPGVTVTCFVDSDHAHDTVTRRSVTGYIIVLNSMPFIWFSKRQGSVESSTYGAEFVAMRLAVERLKGVRYSLRMLGIQVDQPCIVFGDNLAVVSNATDPASMLKKKHLGISHHLVRESVAARIIRVFHILTDDNPANAFTKSETVEKLKILEEMFFLPLCMNEEEYQTCVQATRSTVTVVHT
ncbi:MAG: reverse transcriptase domain-containing protein, partial [Gaiellaceae bacterium]